MSGVVVGVDGSEGSARALAWAVTEAKLRNTPLTVIHAWHETFIIGYPLLPVVYESEPFEKASQQVLDDAVDAVDTAGVSHVERKLVQGGGASVLIEASKDADLLVVGARGIGGFLGLLLGSITNQVTHHAACPVVVVPI